MLFIFLLTTDGLNTDLHLDTGKAVKSCYLGDMLDVDGGCDSVVTARVRSAWKKFCEYLSILTGKGFSLKLKGKLYTTCVRSCLMHGSETWPMKVEQELKLNRTEISMTRWMCGVKLNERKKSEELKRTFRIGTSQFDDQQEIVEIVWTC